MIVLDTHIWLRWLLPSDPLPTSLVEIIEAEDKVAVSSISCWEVTLLSVKGRIDLGMAHTDRIKEALDNSGVVSLPVNCEIAEKSASLPEHHKDPADRMIIATAMVHTAKLASLDRVFPYYQEIKNYLLKS